MNRKAPTLAVLCCCLSIGYAQQFRSGTFLHHSTGASIWGPNGSSTSVPAEIAAYNTAHGLSGTNGASATEVWWPATLDNEWVTWHQIFENQVTPDADIRPILADNRIIIIKSCFPSSDIEGMGLPSDSLSPSRKTIANYKWHWRSILNVMRVHPDNFFVIWTNAPLVAGATNLQAAHFSDLFCRWAIDTLAQGGDPVAGSFPKNVYVFDFFHKLAGSDGMLKAEYASSSSDSHPNGAATTLVAPQLVQEVFTAAIGYEHTTSVHQEAKPLPEEYFLSQNYPNPFNPVTHFEFRVPEASRVTVRMFDPVGKIVATLVEGVYPAGRYHISFDGTRIASGQYFCRMQAKGFVTTRKITLVK